MPGAAAASPAHRIDILENQYETCPARHGEHPRHRRALRGHDVTTHIPPIDIGGLVRHPFTPRPVNPATPQTREPTIAWLREFGLLTSPTAVQRYDAMRFERLNGLAYPAHRGDGLRLGNDTMGWFFIFDDQFDGPLGQDPALAARIVRDMAAVLDEDVDGPVAGDRLDLDPLTRAFQDLWRRSITGMSATWRVRARQSWIRYLSSYLWEAEARAWGELPDLCAYLKNRQDSIGIPPAVDLAERIQGFELPAAAAEMPETARMMALTGEEVALVNDLFSVHKEMAGGDVQNGVIILLRTGSLGLEEAVRQVAEMIRARHAEFQRLRSALPTACTLRGFTGDETDAVVRYTDCMADWMHANLTWSLETARYTVPGVAWANSGGAWQDLLR